MTSGKARGSAGIERRSFNAAADPRMLKLQNEGTDEDDDERKGDRHRDRRVAADGRAASKTAIRQMRMVGRLARISRCTLADVRRTDDVAEGVELIR